MATDVDAVYAGWGTPEAKAIKRASPDAIEAYEFAAGSMGPKVDAACRFARRTGASAAIGALGELPAIVEGRAGTTVSGDLSGIEWHE